jgi:hypothetical protein
MLRTLARLLLPLGFLPGLLLIASRPDLAAQQVDGLSLEVRGGMAVGNYDPAHAEPSLSMDQPAISVSAQLPLTNRVAGYAGYSYARFGCSGGFCRDASIHFASRGWDVGLQGGRNEGVWARAGAVLHRLDVPLSATGTPRVSSDAALGGHAAIGYGFAWRGNLSVSPGLRYTRYGARFSGDPARDRVDYLVADVGLRFTF